MPPCDHLPHVTFYVGDMGTRKSLMWCAACGALGVSARYADKGEFVPSHFKSREVSQFQAGNVLVKDYWYVPGKEVRKAFESGQPERGVRGPYQKTQGRNRDE